MLKRIIIKNYVLVDELELEFSNGFTVFTGETGAGKSILIDALKITLGERAETLVIRAGAERLEVTSQWELTAESDTLKNWLDENGVSHDDELLLRRVIDRQGKSRAWINSTPVTAVQLKSCAAFLIDIHGQHAYQRLMERAHMRLLLDQYAQCHTLAEQCAFAFQRWREAQQAFDFAQNEQTQIALKRENLNFVLKQFHTLNPQPHEWESLSTNHQRLSHSAQIFEGCNTTLANLSENPNNVQTQLQQVLHILQSLLPHDNQLSNTVSLLENAQIQIDEVVHELQTYLKQSDLDTQNFHEIDERFSQWHSLARKQRIDPAQLAEHYQGLRQAYEELDQAGHITRLESELDHAHRHYQRLAEQLSRVRNQAAPKLGQAVSQILHTLGMQYAKFCVMIEANTEQTPRSFGLEDISFAIASHASSPARSLSKVASGGELSRIALAIAIATLHTTVSNSLIFDEIDAGIGGAVATSVGELLRKLSQTNQVLCVTHLPQVAAFAHQHFSVTKQYDDQAASSQVHLLNHANTLEELARMLAGKETSQEALLNAEQLWKAAQF